MIKYTDLKKTSEERLDDVKVLYTNNRYDGAMYLSGYVLEIALKARICKLLNISEYPDDAKFKQVYLTHDFDVLLKLSGLENELKTGDPSLFTDWSIVTGWNPIMRYQVMGKTKKDIRTMMVSLFNIFRWIKTKW